MYKSLKTCIAQTPHSHSHIHPSKSKHTNNKTVSGQPGEEESVIERAERTQQERAHRLGLFSRNFALPVLFWLINKADVSAPVPGKTFNLHAAQVTSERNRPKSTRPVSPGTTTTSTGSRQRTSGGRPRRNRRCAPKKNT